MTAIRILSEASDELEACASFYNSQRSRLGTDFLVEFDRTVDRIRKTPYAGRLVGDDIRSRPIHRFPFYVLYRSTADEVIIVAVAHRRRQPRYWLGRT